MRRELSEESWLAMFGDTQEEEEEEDVALSESPSFDERDDKENFVSDDEFQAEGNPLSYPCCTAAHLCRFPPNIQSMLPL